MSKKFSELPPKDSLDSADYIPIVDSADSNPETQNKVVTFQTVRGYFTGDLDAFLAQAQSQESARVTAENTRKSNETIRNNNESTRQSNESTRQSNEETRLANETAREDAETGYIQQAKSWAVGTNGVARAGDATDNAKYYAEQAGASATGASASATSASESATTAGTAKDAAQAAAIEAAASAESVDAPALTKKILAAFPKKSVSGEVLTFTDGADNIPVNKMVINLEPHQDGTGDPSPDNIRPISGYDAVKVTRAGKNLLSYLNNRTSNGVTFTANADSSMTVTGTATSNAYSDGSLSAGNLKKGYPYLPAGDYIVSGFTANVHGYTQIADETGTQIGDTIVAEDTERQITLTQDAYIYLRAQVVSGTTVDELIHPMIRSASFTDATFEPYRGEEYTLTIPTAAGTVYGGKLTVNQDGTGTLTVDRGIVDLGDKTYNLTSNASRHFYYYDASAVIDAPEANSVIIKNAISSAYNVGTYLNVYNNSVDNCIGVSVGGRVAIYDVYAKEQNLSAADFAQYVSGRTFVYPLATPTAYALTAEQVTTLLGNNTLWMDADGTVDVEYRADTQMYIDNKLTAQKSIIAGVESTFTATKNYSIGQYLIVGDDLYKVTAAIANGGTITVGTNVTKTTVAEQLIALASA